jgi:hypothetical protein
MSVIILIIAFMTGRSAERRIHYARQNGAPPDARAESRASPHVADRTATVLFV